MTGLARLRYWSNTAGDGVRVQVMNGGLIGAYATLVDNLTNDSTYLGAQLGAQEN